MKLPSSVTLSFLLQRLKWPVSMVRWRSAKEVRDLLNELSTRAAMNDALLIFLDRCGTESEVCSVLSIIFLADPAARPPLDDVVNRIQHPSILADELLDLAYGQGSRIGGWWATHAGTAPIDFDAGDYFQECNIAHLAPFFLTELQRLQRNTGLPFLRQWAFEWHTLREKHETRYTRYPHYFDNVSDARWHRRQLPAEANRDISLSLLAHFRICCCGVGHVGRDCHFSAH